MKQYLELLQDVLENGEYVNNGRTKEGYYSVFGRQVRYNLREGFPAVTTKKLWMKGVIVELLWFLKGDTNVKFLQDHGVHIWDEWATKEECAKFGRPEGELGPIYGRHFRRWDHMARCTKIELEEIKKVGGLTSDFEKSKKRQYFFGDDWDSSTYYEEQIDQIQRVIDRIKTNPSCRRLIVTAWDPATCEQVSLPPCHTMFQFKVSHGGTRLNCQLYQRSADGFLGVPFNIASYALLTHMIAQVCDLEVGEFIHTFGDLHIYENHINQVKEQLSREPLPLPKLWLNPEIKDIDKFKVEDIKLLNYESHPAIKGEVAV